MALNQNDNSASVEDVESTCCSYRFFREDPKKRAGGHARAFEEASTKRRPVGKIPTSATESLFRVYPASKTMTDSAA
jgi:hypothetical protein